MSSTERPWLASYPEGIPAEIDADEYPSIPALLQEAIDNYRDQPAFSNMGVSITYGELDTLSTQFASYLLGELKLKKGDRIAIMMPNCLQYPIATFGALRAGLAVVNTNPMYTARELRHQLVDSGARAILVLDNFGHVVEKVLADTSVETVITTGLGDMLGFPKSVIVNTVVKHVRKMVPDYSINGAIRFRAALKKGAAHALPAVDIDPGDIAFLQYTGGTTGVAKGAMEAKARPRSSASWDRAAPGVSMTVTRGRLSSAARRIPRRASRSAPGPSGVRAVCPRRSWPSSSSG